MEITYRLANENDTSLLANWWRDGEVMEHAGFPYGLTIDEEKLLQRLQNQENHSHKVYIIESNSYPIGEMGVKMEGNVAEIGIKICDRDNQNKGIGTLILKRLIKDLFMHHRVELITLDTMLENTRAQKVYERLGFSKTGEAVDVFTDQLGQKRTAVLYELHKKDYQF